MAAPQFVPTPPTHNPRRYHSPLWREGEWWAVRPGDVDEAGRPEVDDGRMGAPGPDQGYILTLVPLLRDELHLTAGEELAAVERGSVAVALKRASIYGRAPIIHDLRVAYTVWGYLDANAPEALVTERRRRFEGVHHTAAHYAELRAVADAVPAASLRQTPAEVADAYRTDWRALLVL